MIVFVTGTGTEVGKTWTLVRVVRALRAGGQAVTVHKPVQSYAPDELGHTDADLLADAADVAAGAVCPDHRRYAIPMAPPMAADVLGAPPFTIAELAAEVRAAMAPHGVAFVEGAGGPRSPLAIDGDNVDLARAVGASLAVLVADPGLGTINAVRLCVDALAGFDTLVTLNRFEPGDDLHRRNRDWLVEAGYQVLEDHHALSRAVMERVP